MGKDNGLMRVVLGLLGLIISMTLFLTFLGGMVNLRNAATSRVDIATGVITNNATYTATVNLTYALLNDAVDNAGVVSSNGTDVPVASTYTEPTLTVSGLVDNGTRTLTTTYSEGLMSYFPTFDIITAISPVVIFLGLLGGFGYITVSGVRKYRSR